MVQTVDERYFTNYCGYGNYDDNYLYHSGVVHCISVVERYRIDIQGVLVLGAATGKVLEDFEQAFGVLPFGCELSQWAHGRIPGRYRRRVRHADMRDYIPWLHARRRRFDLAFSNSFVYLQEHEVAPLVADLSRMCGHLHFASSTRESHEPGDHYRTLLRSNAWWRDLFKRSGFVATRSPYLWRSSRSGCWRDTASTALGASA